MISQLPRWSLALLIPVVAFVVLIAIAAVDASAHSNNVARNVRLGDEIIGGMSEAELTSHVESIADRYADIPVIVQTPEGEISTTTSALGLAVDVETTVADALSAGGGGSLVTLPFRWIGTLWGGPSSDISFMVDASELDKDVLAGLATDPVEPTIGMTDGVLSVEAGTNGQGIDTASLLAALPAAAAQGGFPLKVEVAFSPVPPNRSVEEVEFLRDELRSLLSTGTQVVVNEEHTIIAPAMLESWLILTDTPEGLSWELDDELVLADLELLLSNSGASSGTAAFIVKNDRVSIVSSDGGKVCCDESASDIIERGIRAATGEPVNLPLRDALPEEGLEAAEALGVKELVGEFTTNHQCCAGRVDNIQRIAQLMQGYVILPGEELSINGYIGRRTKEKGFVSAGVIKNGVFDNDVGGGISQFATTLFNAAFFGGLDFGEYQSHSIYISRYPYGREATLNYEHPDLVIQNTTPYGVLVWPTWTDTSITVQLYSTKHAVTEETGQVTSSSGKCTVVTTNRQRTYPDGAVVDDSVFARYRPGQGLDCAGNSTDPNATTTTTEDPNATTTTDPNATTTVDPNVTTTVDPNVTTVPPTTVPPTTAGPTTTIAEPPPSTTSTTIAEPPPSTTTTLAPTSSTAAATTTTP